MSSTAASIKVVKSFSYRGGTKEWSNRYHFTAGAPSDSTHWTTLSDAIVTAEKAALATTVTIVATIGYAAGSEVPVFNKTYSTAGTLNVASAFQSTGDSCALVRFSTNDRTSKNHPIYLYNYFHGAYAQSAGFGDTLLLTLGTALGTYATSWIAGFSDGTTTHVRCGPKGHTATGQLVSGSVHHRDFPS